MGTASASSSLSKDEQAISYVPKVKRHTTLPAQPLQSLHTKSVALWTPLVAHIKNKIKLPNIYLN
jgi:hypothetical protein